MSGLQTYLERAEIIVADELANGGCRPDQVSFLVASTARWLEHLDEHKGQHCTINLADGTFGVYRP